MEKQERKSPACPKSRKKYGVQHQQKQREKKRGERKEMKKAAKKLLTFVMAAAMLIGSVPMSAFAADTNDSSGSNADVASTGTEMETFRTRFGSKS